MNDKDSNHGEDEETWMTGRNAQHHFHRQVQQFYAIL